MTQEEQQVSSTDDSTDNSGRRVTPDEDPAAVTKDPAATPKPDKAKSGLKGAGSKDPAQLAADIEKTREELAETLDAIAEKVSPKRVAKRTTKKVTDAVKDTATSAKDKVSGATSGRSDTSWAPDPGAVSDVTAVPELPPTAPVEVPTLQTTTYVPPQVTTPPGASMSTYTTSGSLLKPEYIVAGVVAGLLAWFLLRKRRR